MPETKQGPVSAAPAAEPLSAILAEMRDPCAPRAPSLPALADRIDAAVQRFVADDCAKCAHYNAATISLKDALDLANTIANHGINATDLGDKASATIYALCHEVRTVRGEDANIKQEVQKLRRELRDLRRAPGNAAAMRAALEDVRATLQKWYCHDNGTMGIVVRLRQKCDAALAAPPEPPSNAAAIREALTTFVDSVQWLCDGDERGVFKKQFAPLLSEARDALAGPARNCDVSRDTKETIERCLADLNVESSSASFDAGVCAAIGWMLAAPKEGGLE